MRADDDGGGTSACGRSAPRGRSVGATSGGNDAEGSREEGLEVGLVELGAVVELGLQGSEMISKDQKRSETIRNEKERETNGFVDADARGLDVGLESGLGGRVDHAEGPRRVSRTNVNGDGAGLILEEIVARLVCGDLGGDRSGRDGLGADTVDRGLGVVDPLRSQEAV